MWLVCNLNLYMPGTGRSGNVCAPWDSTPSSGYLAFLLSRMVMQYSGLPYSKTHLCHGAQKLLTDSSLLLKSRIWARFFCKASTRNQPMKARVKYSGCVCEVWQKCVHSLASLFYEMQPWKYSSDRSELWDQGDVFTADIATWPAVFVIIPWWRWLLCLRVDGSPFSEVRWLISLLCSKILNL